VLKKIQERCKNNEQQSILFTHYINQEVAEKSSIKLSSKDLNNSAVNDFQKGDIDNAMQVFTQALTLMPKNASIALNLMQVMTSNAAKLDVTTIADPRLKKCIKVIEMSKLNEAQQQRYQRIRTLLDALKS
jgi:Tfp pilus assembly protein PilF